jgi:cytoskeleton protein RodZ
VESAADNAEVKPLGRILAEERERQGLSRIEAAQRLHMSAYQIEALEGGDYSRLPRGTFLRGFVRNYGRMLGLDAESLLSQLAQAAPRSPAPDIVVPTQNIRFDPLGERLTNPYVKAGVLAVVVVAIAFAAMYWWLFIRPAPMATHAMKPGTQPAGVEASRGGPPQQIADAPMSAPEPVAPSPAPVLVDAPPPQAEPAKPGAARTAGERTLRFRFRGESWVEVKDAEGKVLLSRLNSRGAEAEVAGRPPLTVIVGNAQAVDMLYDDAEFPLEPHTKVGVARLTLE